jgi:tetratricopeptide (TPR) repeat protein
MTLFILYSLLLASLSPSELEIAGNLPEAGLAWQEDGSLDGQSRVLCRLLEEALYAGHGNRAMILMSDLQRFGVAEDLIDFWFARLAWICGLENMAADRLESFQGNDWLGYRARGMAQIMRRHPEEAIADLELSVSLAGSTRRRFYSVIDLCWANLAAGNTIESIQIATFLVDSFPNEGLPQIILAVCYQESGRYASAMMMLQNTSLNSNFGVGPRSMAVDLLSDYE